MLKYLHIENIAVIEKSDIELAGGFHVLTGETGAGKSIVIDSINAVLGERTSKELIRAGCDKAEVSAVFGDLCGEVVAILQANGFSPDEDGNIIVRRTLSMNGSGMIRLNGSPVSAATLKEIGRTLVNIHGQHDNQNLLDPKLHCGYIDRVAGNAALREEYYAEFKKLNAIRRELAALETDEDEKQRRIDLLKYQINELETASVRVGELDELKQQLAVAESYETTMNALNNAYFMLNGNDDESGAVTLLEGAQKLLTTIKEEKFSAHAGQLADVLCILEEIGCDIRDYTENTEYRFYDSNVIQDRLDFLYKLMLKYGHSEEKMIEFLENARKELDKITFSDQRTAELAEQLEQSTERLVALGEQLSQSRKTAADQFSQQVTEVLRYLDMPDVSFTVDFIKGRYTKNGCDEVQFLISANAGESVKPLHKIASGGELSRVMLAIKSVLADKDEVQTLIFDEIDTGISGRAAGKVGRQLKKVSRNRQVLCVTHLAQIAAFADSHLLIEKHTENARTFTSVLPLSEEQRIREIARIMSGTELTENLFNSAKELLDRSKTDDDL